MSAKQEIFFPPRRDSLNGVAATAVLLCIPVPALFGANIAILMEISIMLPVTPQNA